LKAIRTILKILTSGELVELLDKDGNGRVSWQELTNAPISVWFEIILKFAPTIAMLFM
jgi:hypothetical protein